ncbi:MAG TPA: acetolactate synthase small subunit [Clostridiales bacterium]|nr:acetolactate synthase small subunit [Clostridiales bacterium]
MKHTIVARVDNKAGVVSRISGLFTRRGYNIESLVTSVTGDPGVYHLTILVIGSEQEVELLINQLGRIMEVIDVHNVNEFAHVVRELMLIKVSCPVDKRSEILSLADILKCRVVGIGTDSAVFEITGDESKLDTIIRSFEPMGIMEIVRSGAIAIARD